MPVSSPPDIGLVREAAARLSGVARRTPLLEDALLNRVAGRRILVKAESLQVTGSFKFRGAWNRIAGGGDTAKGVVAFSSGNHGQAVARAAALRGLPAVVVMPGDAPAMKIEATRAQGAEIILYDRATQDRQEIAEKLGRERGLAVVPPFDDPLVIAGQGTAGLEIAEQAAEAGANGGAVLVCCAGGGFSSGVALALEAEAPGWRVHPCEPAGFDDMARSLAAGERMTNTARDGSLQDALLTPTPGSIVWPIARRLLGPGFAATDAEALRAMAVAFARLKLVLEPGGACALACALRACALRGVDAETVVVTASGGNVDAATFARALQDHG